MMEEGGLHENGETALDFLAIPIYTPQDRGLDDC